MHTIECTHSCNLRACTYPLQPCTLQEVREAFLRDTWESPTTHKKVSGKKKHNRECLTNACPAERGLMSKNAYAWSFSASLWEGISPLIILQKMQEPSRCEEDIVLARCVLFVLKMLPVCGQGISCTYKDTIATLLTCTLAAFHFALSKHQGLAN